MIYLKSVMAGLLAVVAASITLSIVGIIGIILYDVIHPPPEGTSVGWDPISLWIQRPPLPMVAIIVLLFASGFFWEFRRLMHR